MAHLGDSDLSERARVIQLAVATTGVVLLTTTAFAVADVWWVFYAIYEQTVPVQAALHLALWGSIMLLLSRIRQMLRGAGALTKSVARLLLRLPFFILHVIWRGAVLVWRFVFGVIPAVLRFAFGDGYDLIALRFRIWFDPAFRVCGAVSRWIAPVRARLRAARAALAHERALRRAYANEFRNHYPSFRAFRAAFDAKSDAGTTAPPAAYAFRAACAALGLREDGGFSQQEFKTQYRAAMKAIHPDIAGTNDRAAAINAAAALIKQRKDWK